MGHHFNPASIIIVPPGPSDHASYELVFINTDSREQVRMAIPRFGMFSDPDREITPAEVQQVANFIANYLHDYSGGGGQVTT